jgi:hypothetical protein
MDSSSVTKDSWPPGLAGYPGESWLVSQTKSPVLSPSGELPLASIHGYCVSEITIGLRNCVASASTLARMAEIAPWKNG